MTTVSVVSLMAVKCSYKCTGLKSVTTNQYAYAMPEKLHHFH